MSSIASKLTGAHRAVQNAEREASRIASPRVVAQHEQRIEQAEAEAEKAAVSLDSAWRAVEIAAGGEKVNRHDHEQAAALLAGVDSKTRAAYLSAVKRAGQAREQLDERKQALAEIHAEAERLRTSAADRLESANAEAKAASDALLRRTGSPAEAAEQLADALEGGLIDDLRDLDALERHSIAEAGDDAARTWQALRRVVGALLTPDAVRQMSKHAANAVRDDHVATGAMSAVIPTRSADLRAAEAERRAEADEQRERDAIRATAAIAAELQAAEPPDDSDADDDEAETVEPAEAEATPTPAWS